MDYQNRVKLFPNFLDVVPVILSCLAGIRDRYVDLLKILSTCLPDLAGIVSKERYSPY